jgi:hypothetical protein
MKNFFKKLVNRILWEEDVLAADAVANSIEKGFPKKKK